ncbi:MAG: peptidylprolyl isomerase [Prolixibacteraceae bacterium]|nr:peptidylprolyl isomerase [Prolixibacteraceae bacterium]
MKRIFLIGFLIFSAFQLAAQNRIVQISTNLGSMKFSLYNETPKHRDAFIQLAKEGYYDQTLFYRVIQDFLIQGGSRSSRNAAPGKRIGYGDPDKTVDDEIRAQFFHQKGALCAPRRPDEVNPFKQSDISQFFIIKGKVYSEGELDTLEIAVNRPIQKKINARYLTPEIREKLKKLKAEKKVEEFRAIADEVKRQIDTDFSMHPGKLIFSKEQRKAYTTVGGYPDLDGKYTIFGQCISGMDVIDKIAALKTDENNRPFSDVKITVTVIE